MEKVKNNDTMTINECKQELLHLINDAKVMRHEVHLMRESIK